jgi:hypothetical protein
VAVHQRRRAFCVAEQCRLIAVTVCEGLPMLDSAANRRWFWRWWLIVFVPQWPLPYKSALVAPIRYIKRFEPPEKQSVEPHWLYRGFLCVDCPDKYSYRDPLLVELAGGFAYSLYAFLTNYEHLLDGRLDDGSAY